ncbi:catalase [Duganella sp. FT135W]|uniref:Catalase-related peroxidase n=1 Tax=Duganella flavida TaxID=2692175 RepID=A0A6L8K8W1_9BURK|nr:catalase family peroxidase [Duganella flavida]MYM22638.1 catalase [Duganella flavida]
MNMTSETSINPAIRASAPTPATMIDALNNTFGKHVGKRASHAKGFCVHGQFTPAPDSAQFVSCPLFSTGPMDATARFSVGGGNPGVSDKSRSVRGLAMRVAGGGESWDLVLISEPVFFAATPESFVSFLAARIPDPHTQKPSPEKITAHTAAYPDGALQPALLASHAAPLSYATTPYFSNNAFLFKSACGQEQYARIIVTPVAGTYYLSEEDESNLPDVFLEDEFKARLQNEPVQFEIVALLPAETDSLTDPSQRWAGAGRISLGRLRITAIAEAGACDGMVFIPVNLPSGIETSEDPILLARAAAYGISLSRRKTVADDM